MARKEIKKSVYPIIVFEKVGQSFIGTPVKIRKEVETVNGKCDVLDLADENGEVNSVFLSAALRLFPWGDVMGKKVELEYTGQVKNPKNNRSYANYKVYELDDAPEEKAEAKAGK